MDNSLRDYLAKYKTYKKNIVYKFNLEQGGVGDFTKFFLMLLYICIKKEFRIYYLSGNCIVKDYLLLRDKDMYITEEQMVSPIEILNVPADFNNIQDGLFYTITHNVVNNMYPSIYELYDYPIISLINQLFYFSDEVIQNAASIIDTNTPYLSIHLRLGDRHLEIDRHLIHCYHDVRQYNERHLFEFIEKNTEIPVLFFCDNHGYRAKLKDKYPTILITNYEIGHTTYTHTTRKQVLNTISEFYLLSKSQSIYVASYSGFSIMASKFHNIPLLYPPGGRPPAP